MRDGRKSAMVPDAGEFRQLVDGALRELDADERRGPLVRATDLSLRIEIADLGLVVRVAPSEPPDRHLSWNYDDDGPPAKLELRMDSATAHAYLQGDESLAIAIAKGRVRLRGESRFALLYLPVISHVAGPYRRLVQERFPHLAAV
ncbi:MAG: hypothetical protein M3383_04745 [Actinomycetota bacterium]|nr:hypothetical protein [Actinomycetota bacterium]